MARKHTWPEDNWGAYLTVTNAMSHLQDGMKIRAWDKPLTIFERMSVLEAISILDQRAL